jgi:hypothetical protein
MSHYKIEDLERIYSTSTTSKFAFARGEDNKLPIMHHDDLLYGRQDTILHE